MKRSLYICSVAIMALLASCSSSRNFAQSNDQYYHEEDQGEGVTYQQFYDDLSPYGNWIMYPGYGYVWAPYDVGFMPYQTNGRWVYAQVGWTWVSNYRWGWAPFHYGRWFRDRFHGWLWVPGYEWAPAWVAWRGGGGYYGWAPLGPGMSINISFGSIPHNNWCFVPSRYINSYRMDRYYVRPSRNVTIINNTTIINNYYDGRRGNNGYGNNRYGNGRGSYNAGPRIMDVERQTNQKIAPVRIVNRTSPGNSQIDRNQVAIYRPQVRETSSNISPKNYQTAPKREFNTTPKQNSGNEFQNNGITPPSRQMEKRDNEIRNIDNSRKFERNNQSPVNTNPPVIQRQHSDANQNRTEPVEQNRYPNGNVRQPVRKFTPADDSRTERPQMNEKRVREMPVQQERRVTPRENKEVKIEQRRNTPQQIEHRQTKQRPVQRDVPTKTNKRTFKNG